MKELYRREMEAKSLRDFKRSCREKLSFHKKDQKAVLTAIKNERKNEIRMKMPGLLRGGHTVYCRNFSLSLTGHLCSSLECPHKDRKENIVQGCTNCMKFHVSRGGSM